MTAVVLDNEERQAAIVVLGASRGELMNALTTLPSYQRMVVRWLARAVTAARDRQGEEYVAVLERQRARRRALEALERLRVGIAATVLLDGPRAELLGGLTALWAEAEVAMGELGDEPVFPTSMSTLEDK